MYNTPHFKASDEQDVIAFMHAHPFVVLCGVDKNNKPVATHVPCLIDQREGRLFILAHVMRKQEHTKAFENNPDVLVIFHGAHTHVSASWYEKKEVASTWNYQAVHAKGILRFSNDEALHDLLIRLTEKFENNPHSPALVQKMDQTYVTNMMKAIIAFEIEVTSLEHVFKLSQNRDERSYENIIDHLNEQDANARSIAEEMKKQQHKTFHS